jgi:hypothetical protein
MNIGYQREGGGGLTLFIETLKKTCVNVIVNA